jgi:hypothetical protein
MLNGLAKSRELFVGDFETTTDPNDCRVWFWAMCSVETEEIDFGLDIDSFMDYLKQRNTYTWFHNLAFDGSFIIDWLLRNGWTWVKEHPKDYEFTTLISAMGKFYSVQIVWDKKHKTEFRDSLKKIPMSVSSISGSFGLAATKGSIDYNKPRPKGYQPDQNEIEYICNDVLIVAQALKHQLKEGLTALTVGSDALREYKLLTGKDHFERLFPVLPKHTDDNIRLAYRGGFTYADPRFSKRVLGKGKVFDVNSLYPSVMYDRPLPYGMPIWQSGKPKEVAGYPLYITSVTITAKLKNHRIPCIQIKGYNIFSSTEYQREISEPVTLVCTSVDWALWNEQYDIEVLSYNGTWYFHSAIGLFAKYISKWSKIKEQSTGGLRTIAKLQLNSLYGKFATNPNVTPKIPIMEDNKVRLVLGDDETRDPVYTAMGAFITAYARDFTIRNAQKHYFRFAYADTDSLHLIGSDDVQLDVHPTRLGAWKHEYDFDEAFFMRAKAYTERHTNGELETHIAGLPIDAAKQVTFEDYKTGRVFGGKLSPKRVPGGIVLEDVGFTLVKVDEPFLDEMLSESDTP